jgi:hypothetical protein
VIEDVARGVAIACRLVSRAVAWQATLPVAAAAASVTCRHQCAPTHRARASCVVEVHPRRACVLRGDSARGIAAAFATTIMMKTIDLASLSNVTGGVWMYGTPRMIAAQRKAPQPIPGRFGLRPGAVADSPNPIVPRGQSYGLQPGATPGTRNPIVPIAPGASLPPGATP